MAFEFKKENGNYLTYTSLNAETLEEKLRLMEIITNPISLKEVGTPIELTDIYLTTVEYKNKEKKSPDEADYLPGLRIILIDKNGKSYSTGSVGVVSSLELMANLFGEWPWNPPIKVISEKKERKTGLPIRVLTAVI